MYIYIYIYTYIYMYIVNRQMQCLSIFRFFVRRKPSSVNPNQNGLFEKRPQKL